MGLDASGRLWRAETRKGIIHHADTIYQASDGRQEVNTGPKERWLDPTYRIISSSLLPRL